jgi:hypothetical protein
MQLPHGCDIPRNGVFVFRRKNESDLVIPIASNRQAALPYAGHRRDLVPKYGAAVHGRGAVIHARDGGVSDTEARDGRERRAFWHAPFAFDKNAKLIENIFLTMTEAPPAGSFECSSSEFPSEGLLFLLPTADRHTAGVSSEPPEPDEPVAGGIAWPQGPSARPPHSNKRRLNDANMLDIADFGAGTSPPNERRFKFKLRPLIPAFRRTEPS